MMPFKSVWASYSFDKRTLFDLGRSFFIFRRHGLTGRRYLVMPAGLFVYCDSAGVFKWLDKAACLL
jgi:hypothetical protein